MILDDVSDFLYSKAEELSVEDINSVNYWINKASISDDEFYEFALDRCNRVVESAPDFLTALMASWVDAFMIGLITGGRLKVK